MHKKDFHPGLKASVMIDCDRRSSQSKNIYLLYPSPLKSLIRVFMFINPSLPLNKQLGSQWSYFLTFKPLNLDLP